MRDKLEAAAYDKHGRQIKVGDVLKVFHFTGARRKRYYMYKHVVGTRPANNGGEFLVVSHLNLKPLDGRDAGYWIFQEGQIERDTEIVQSSDDYFEDRPRLPAILSTKEQERGN
ncbi:hypothetical protein [Novosphingobium olei]|uniref:Uncharacterized protein n=1 Tax=Novosphingobium olei TaxID=2728851 RepID=A0A7Y0G9B3_9SPHN|nr:hypothetical protein [Novosphingobium olei]NML93830.1 hypothetical protein [Novosphingobium olei]